MPDIVTTNIKIYAGCNIIIFSFTVWGERPGQPCSNYSARILHNWCEHQ